MAPPVRLQLTTNGLTDSPNAYRSKYLHATQEATNTYAVPIGAFATALQTDGTGSYFDD